MNRDIKEKNTSFLLIMLCWLVYTCSYIGKLSYNANINQIGEFFNVSYSQTGLVSTFFFFSYGIGQVINGIFCKKYNIKYVIFFNLIIGSITNLLVVSVSNFLIIKYIWLINGIAMSFLWTSLIRLLSETLEKKDLTKAIIAMGTTVATGTFIVYGMSSLFVAFLSFYWTFYIASGILLIVSLIWLFSYNKLINSFKNKTTENKTIEKTININSERIFLLIFVLVFFAIANNFVKDGLTAWTPDILSSLYDTPGWLSILLTLLLPSLAIGGTIIAVKMYDKIKDFVIVCAIFFILSTILIGVVIILITTPNIYITICCFSIVSCVMAAVNNIITSMVPLHLKDKINSGKLAGILNGFCYLGSTLSSYGLGVIADRFGWLAVFRTLLFICLFVALIGIIYCIIKSIKRKEEKYGI